MTHPTVSPAQPQTTGAEPSPMVAPPGLTHAAGQGPTICSIDGCDHVAHSRGWCITHYSRWRIHGNPLTVKQIRGDDQTRFWEKVDRSDPTGCWEFQGARDKDGYGSVWYRGSQRRAPRVAWLLTNGEIPDGQVVRHRCDNPPCVNPDHLELGTARENDNDRLTRERSARGTANGGGSKLSEAAIPAIRAAVADGRIHGDVAAAYGVARATISRIARRELWGWVS